MKVAIASMGTVPDAWVGIRFGLCSQFLVFDLDTMEYVVVSVPPRVDERDQLSLAAIRAIARQDVAAVVTGHIKDQCRQTLLDLGIEVIEGVEGMTVQEALERFQATGLKTPGERQGMLTRVAVVAHGDGLDARLEPHFQTCSAFILVDPRTMAWDMIAVEPDGPTHRVNVNGVRAVARSGAVALIAPQIHYECSMALQALGIAVFIAPEGITVREAIDLYEQGKLEESRIALI
ncbi:MAG: hypothetical protein JXD18_04715 [Anaerolineae bacterium]|nr:hypothetical protein [Anaerolineae bacterium]